MHWLQLNADNTVQAIIQSNINLTEEPGWLSISASEYVTFTDAQNELGASKSLRVVLLSLTHRDPHHFIHSASLELGR